MSLSPQAIASAATILCQRRRTGTQGPVLPDACRPQTLSDAWSVQQGVAAQFAQMGDAVGGWKCGTPAPDRLVVAPIYRSTVHHQDTSPVWAHDGRVRVEPELAFVLAHDLPPRSQAYSRAEVEAALASAHLALELIDSRYDAQAQLTFADKLADGLVNQGLWLGPQIPVQQAIGAVSMRIRWRTGQGPEQQLEGVHPDQDPLAPLVWLVNYLSECGQGMSAGLPVITGSYAGTIACPVDEALYFGFADWPEMSLRLVARPLVRPI